MCHPSLSHPCIWVNVLGHPCIVCSTYRCRQPPILKTWKRKRCSCPCGLAIPNFQNLHYMEKPMSNIIWLMQCFFSSRCKGPSFFFSILGKMLRIYTWQWQLTDQLAMSCGSLIASCWLWYDITPSDKLCKNLFATHHHSLTKLCQTFLQARYSTSIVNIL